MAQEALAEQIKKEALIIEESRPKLKTTHEGNELIFLHPAYNPNTYANVAEAISQDNLLMPTMAETASLIFAAFDSNDKYSNEIKKIIKDEWLWAYTGTLYVPNKGAYVHDNPEIRDGMPFMEESELVKKLGDKDPNVRFAKFGYETGQMTPLKLAKNDYVIALAGEEGAEKLAEVADMYKRKPYLWSFESVDKPITSVSAVDSIWSVDQGLFVVGDNQGYNGGGRAFGVFNKTGKASAKK